MKKMFRQSISTTIEKMNAKEFLLSNQEDWNGTIASKNQLQSSNGWLLNLQQKTN